MTPQNLEYLEVPVKDGTKFLIDWDDFISYGHLPWHASGGRVTCGVYGQTENGDKVLRILILSRLVKGLEPGDLLEVDHINGDPRDNRKVNLRVCPHEYNMRNRRKHKNNASGFKGVRQVGPDRWSASIGECGRHYHLGVFDSPEKAYRVYCEAAAWLHGEFANFGEDRSQGFSLPVCPEVMPFVLAVPARRRRTLASRAGFGVWGLTKGPRPSIVANHPIFS